MENSDVGTSSSNAGGGKYQVFLNFHGQDTRFGFASVLYQHLSKNGIHVFMDDEELQVGEKISGKLLQAIDDSQIYIPIFSTNYAKSEWCLRELARMVDNISISKEKKILPIFYHVEPNDVNLKTSLYNTAIEKHKEEHEVKQQEKVPHEVESWEEALKKVDKIKGWVLQNCKSEAELVDLAVDEVLRELKIRSKFVTKKLVGLDDRMAEVLDKLDVKCCDGARLLGIYGMGGIGKTTLAKVVYNKLSSHFGTCCAFLDDVREMLKLKGLFWLQKNLLRAIGSSRAADNTNDVDCIRERIEAILISEKVLIVLDDVDEKTRIEYLIGQGQLHPESRIIITTRNIGNLDFIKQKMDREMKEKNYDHALQFLPYEMKGMKYYHALQLFKRHAFPEGSPAKDFDSLSIDIVDTTGGLPLALEVIGSLLYGKDEDIWKGTLHKLKGIPHEKVKERLMISYDALTYHQSQIFLDVACFFINEAMANAIYMWTDCNFHPNLEIAALVSMSLMKIRNNNKFWMHDQLRDLGREIVRRQSPTNLGKRSRLWTRSNILEWSIEDTDDILDLVRTEKEKEDVDALDLRGGGKWGSPIFMSHEEVGRFNNLRFLRLSNWNLHGDYMVYLPKLRWISWHASPQSLSVPSIRSRNLVVLELFNCCFTNSKIWDLIEMATKLKSLALVACGYLSRTPDLSRCLTLERLTFDSCGRLKEIDSSIAKLRCLLDLNITNCWAIDHVPNEIGGLVKLERFSLKSCNNLRELPTSIGKLASLRKLDLSNTGITSLPISIEKLQCLSDLCLRDTKVTKLPNSIGKLTSLCTLDLSKSKVEKNIDPWELPKAIGMLDKLERLYLSCHNESVGKIPDEIGHLSSLRVLHLCWTKIYQVPGTINKLSHLSTLDLTHCDKITELPELPASLVHLRIESRSLQMVPNLSNLINLIELLLSDGSNYRDSSNLKHKCDLGWIGRLSKLKNLELCLLNITAPPTELGHLSLLDDLILCGLDLQPLKQLPPSLLSLQLEKCSSMGSPLSSLKIPSNLTFCVSRLQENQLNGPSQLQHLHLDKCDLQSLSIPSSLRKLSVNDCHNMIEIQFLGMAASLEELSIFGCRSIGRMVLYGEGGSLRVLDQSESSLSGSTYCSLGVLIPNALTLKGFQLRDCEKLLEIQVIGTLLSLQAICITNCNAMEKLTGVSNIKNLQSLDLDGCSKLRVVEGLDELEFLMRLSFYKCPSLETLLDILNSKIPDQCNVLVSHCRKSLNSGRHTTFKQYKRMAQQGAPQSQTNKGEAKMDGDAEEPDTKLQLQFHPSSSSRDREINEEPAIDDVREGTPTRNQNQTREQGSNPQSISPLSSTELQLQFHPGSSSQDHDINEDPPIDSVREETLPENQNQSREQDLNPQSLDELARPRTFSDRFKTCVVSILECVCNRDFA